MSKILRDPNLQRYTLPSLEELEVDYGEVTVVEEVQTPVMDPEEIERQARRKAELIEKEAYDKGFQAGLADGQKSFEQQAAPLMEQLDNIITQFRQLQESQLQQHEPQLLRLAITIAQKVLFDEISSNPDVVVRLVKEGINRLEKLGQITIKIHPSLHELFLKKRPEFLELHQEVVLDIDPSLPVNGPVVVGPMEEVAVNIDELLINVVEDMRHNLAAK